MDFTQTSPSVFYEDDQACVTMVTNHVVTGCNRHFAVKMVWLRQQVADAAIKFVFVAGKNNVADLFTKILAAAAFATLSKMLLCRGMLPRGGC